MVYQAGGIHLSSPKRGGVCTRCGIAVERGRAVERARNVVATHAADRGEAGQLARGG